MTKRVLRSLSGWDGSRRKLLAAGAALVLLPPADAAERAARKPAAAAGSAPNAAASAGSAPASGGSPAPAAGAASVPPGPTAPHRAVLVREFIADAPPTAASHASTLVETAAGSLMAAWFGGTAERAPDVRTWVARHDGRAWSAPEPMAEARSSSASTSLPTWNPVLFQPTQPAGSPLLLFDKLGPDPQHWWGRLRTSTDDGRTWTPPRRLPDGVLGPVRSKPVQLPDGTLLCPSSTEAEDGTWRLHFERSGDGGASWQVSAPVDDPAGVQAIQPTLALRPDGSVLAFARCKAGKIAVTASADGGRTWEPLALTTLPNPNAGIEVLGLADGRLLMVFNPREPGDDWWVGRDRLDLAVSSDSGRHWRHALTLEDEPGQEFSYPAAIQTRDGRVHLSYTSKRTHIRHVVIDPGRLG